MSAGGLSFSSFLWHCLHGAAEQAAVFRPLGNAGPVAKARCLVDLSPDPELSKDLNKDPDLVWSVGGRRNSGRACQDGQQQINDGMARLLADEVGS